MNNRIDPIPLLEWTCKPLDRNRSLELVGEISVLGRGAHDLQHIDSVLGCLTWVGRHAEPNATQDGVPLLTLFLEGWETLGLWEFHRRPRFPVPGDPPWDDEGQTCFWELPAACLLARGANPFVPDPQGRTPFEQAVNLGSVNLVDQMLRHPTCPDPTRWPLIRNPTAPTETPAPALLPPSNERLN